MEIRRNGSQPSVKGPADWFAGMVRIDQLFDAPSPVHVSEAIVTFEPGARTAWHTHPLGQTLVVTAGEETKLQAIASNQAKTARKPRRWMDGRESLASYAPATR